MRTVPGGYTPGVYIKGPTTKGEYRDTKSRIIENCPWNPAPVIENCP